MQETAKKIKAGGGPPTVTVLAPGPLGRGRWWWRNCVGWGHRPCREMPAKRSGGLARQGVAGRWVQLPRRGAARQWAKYVRPPLSVLGVSCSNQQPVAG